ncbi:ATPase, partial [Brachyspira catarrhinii]
AIEEYKRFTSDDKLMRAYAARDAFLVGQKMMLSRERQEGFDEGIEKGKLEGIKEGIKEGIEKGKLEGEKNKSILIAKNLKKSGLDIKFISENTGLSLEEVENL